MDNDPQFNRKSAPLDQETLRSQRPDAQGSGESPDQRDLPTNPWGSSQRSENEVNDSDSQKPEQLGRYQVIEHLGQGGFADVWRAIDPELQRDVAVKVLRPDKTDMPERVNELLDEARRVARLKIRGVVPVYDVGRYGDDWFIVSEYMPGGSLHERLQDAEFSSSDAVELMAELATILHKAHLQNLVHRDIKPGNVLLDAEGNPFLADFGLAVTEAEQLQEQGGVQGTLHYLSPEQARGDSHRVDARSDIYSLGVLLYRLLAFRFPFVAEKPGQYLQQVLSRDPRPPRTIRDSIAPELERICLKCLQRKPIDRYSTAADMAADLRAWLAETRADESSSRNLPPPPETSSKKQTAIIVVVGLALLGALGFAVAASMGLISDWEKNGSTEPEIAEVTQQPVVFQELSDDLIETSRVYSLLQTAPPTVVGPSTPLEGKRYDGETETLHVSHRNSGLFRLGSTDRLSYTIRVDLRQADFWQGQAGIYIGLRERSGAPDTSKQIGQLIVVSRNTGRDKNQMPMLVARYRLEFKDEEINRVYPTVKVPYTQKLPWLDGGLPHQLEIRVSDGRVRRVRFAGQELTDLASGPLNESFKGVGTAGEFGLMTGFVNGSTFERAEIVFGSQ